MEISNNLELFHLLTTYFKARHFQSIPSNIETVSTFATYQKSSLYLINLVVLGKDYVFDYDAFQEFRQKKRKEFSKVKSDKVILLNIMISEMPDSIYKYIDFAPNIDEEFVDIHWIVDSKNKALVIPNRQIKSVLGLDKPIQELISTGTLEFFQLTPLREPSYISFFFILVNVALWVFLEFNGGSMDLNTLLKYGAINSQYILQTGEYWRLFTAMFLHIGFGHLAYNVFALYIFGSRLEKYVSSKKFIFIYIFSGMLGSLFSFVWYLFLGEGVVSAGASGAIYGLLGATLILSNASGQTLEGLSSYTLWLMFLFGIIYSVIDPNIDALAHVGGFIGGLLAGAPIVFLERKQFGGEIDEER